MWGIGGVGAGGTDALGTDVYVHEHVYVYVDGPARWFHRCSVGAAGKTGVASTAGTPGVPGMAGMASAPSTAGMPGTAGLAGAAGARGTAGMADPSRPIRPAPVPAAARPRLADADFDRAPFLVIWETTRACDLACAHCRAEAVPCRDPGELSTLEAMLLMNRVREFGRPLFVLTGGDPLKRPDTVDLVRHGARIGLRMGMTPSGTPLMTPAILERLRDAGLARLAVSLDGSTAAIHDAFRGVAGSFDWTLRMLEAAASLGLSTQVNTTVSRYNLDDFDALCALMTRLGIALWSVFFLVPTGRARREDVASAEEFERVFHRMYDLARTAPFDIKSTAAPQYRRVILQRQVAERRAGERAARPEPLTAGVGFSLADGVGRARGVNDGDGFLFVNHVGEIYPSGFLPVTAGNVRTHDIVHVYRESPLFRSLRDRDALKGKCGVCEYRDVCGGSRARAFAMTGDWLEAEPFCAHVPARWARITARAET